MSSTNRLSTTGQSTLRDQFARVLAALSVAAQKHYGSRLVSLAVFGSVGRGTPRPDSDLDVLIVAEDLPRGRLARMADFQSVEAGAAPAISAAQRNGLAVQCSPIFKTPAEVEAGSPLFLDMIDDASLLYDRDGFFAAALARLSDRLASLGARRIWRGNAWLWDLKPDYRPGDIFEL